MNKLARAGVQRGIGQPDGLVVNACVCVYCTV